MRRISGAVIDPIQEFEDSNSLWRNFANGRRLGRVASESTLEDCGDGGSDMSAKPRRFFGGSTCQRFPRDLLSIEYT
jgi:hypothetical protein